MTGLRGGKAYESFGVDASSGAVVIVRPDGYVSFVCPLEAVNEANEYFESFMRAP
jgi:phenol 2-monooxygenase